MSTASKFAHLRSPLVPIRPEIVLYTRSIDSVVNLRCHSRITNDEAQRYFSELQHATWHVGTLEAIQAVRDEIAEKVK